MPELLPGEKLPATASRATWEAEQQSETAGAETH